VTNWRRRYVPGIDYRDTKKVGRNPGTMMKRQMVEGLITEGKPYIESFFGSYKTEELYRNEYSSLAEARTGWESYRAWYRNDRLHQALWYKSPLDYAKIARKSNLLVA